MSEESYRPEDSIDMKGEESSPPTSDPKIPFDSPLPEMNIDIEYTIDLNRTNPRFSTPTGSVSTKSIQGK